MGEEGEPPHAQMNVSLNIHLCFLDLELGVFLHAVPNTSQLQPKLEDQTL